MSELIIYQSDDGKAQVQFRAMDGSLWLSQLQLAELYGVTVANINIHLRKIVQEGELAAEAVIKQDLIPAADGKRYPTKLYRLDMVLAVGYRVRKADVIVAKNYLSADEVDTLNRLVVIFLEQAELRVKDRQPLTLDYWRQNVDRLLAFNDKPILQGSGKLSNESAKQIAHDRYDSFDAQRRRAEALAADVEDLKALEALAKKGKRS